MSATFSDAEQRAMVRALELAAAVDAKILPNPRVGCVLLTADGTVLAEGAHLGAGTPHAEAAALYAAAESGVSVVGATAVVTLEPCNHTGRTGPCAQALIDAGIARVVFAVDDPNPGAAGGAATLRDAGVEVESGLENVAGVALNRAWLTAVARSRPWVVWKVALTLDGRVAAADGSSKWITSAAARTDVHRLRAQADCVLVGTGTALRDDPALTVRNEAGDAIGAQPMRAAMGLRSIPADARLRDGTAEFVHLATQDPHAALAALWDRERRHVFLEGGPSLAAAFLRAGLVDEIVAYVAPVWLGAGTAGIADIGITSIDDALRPTVTDISVITDPVEAPVVRFTMTPTQLMKVVAT